MCAYMWDPHLDEPVLIESLYEDWDSDRYGDSFEKKGRRREAVDRNAKRDEQRLAFVQSGDPPDAMLYRGTNIALHAITAWTLMERTISQAIDAWYALRTAYYINKYDGKHIISKLGEIAGYKFLDVPNIYSLQSLQDSYTLEEMADLRHKGQLCFRYHGVDGKTEDLKWLDPITDLGDTIWVVYDFGTASRGDLPDNILTPLDNLFALWRQFQELSDAFSSDLGDLLLYLEYLADYEHDVRTRARDIYLTLNVLTISLREAATINLLSLMPIATEEEIAALRSKCRDITNRLDAITVANLQEYSAVIQSMSIDDNLVAGLVGLRKSISQMREGIIKDDEPEIIRWHLHILMHLNSIAVIAVRDPMATRARNASGVALQALTAYGLAVKGHRRAPMEMIRRVTKALVEAQQDTALAVEHLSTTTE